jgi:hypothetical protein
MVWMGRTRSISSSAWCWIMAGTPAWAFLPGWFPLVHTEAAVRASRARVQHAGRVRGIWLATRFGRLGAVFGWQYPGGCRTLINESAGL